MVISNNNKVIMVINEIRMVIFGNLYVNRGPVLEKVLVETAAHELLTECRFCPQTNTTVLYPVISP